MKDLYALQKDSAAWVAFVKISFVISLGATSFGIFFLPVDLWVKGYMAIGLYFCVASTLMLSKTIRDEYEAGKLLNKLTEAKTEKMLKEYDLVS